MNQYNDYLTTSINNDFNYLAHYGVPGMHPRVHTFGKYQNHAVYARGAKKYAEKAKQAFGKLSDAAKQTLASAKEKLNEKTNEKRMRKATDGDENAGRRLSQEIDNMSDKELAERTRRLNLEKDYRNALQNNIKAQRDYQALINAPKEAKRKQFWNDVNTVMKAIGPMTKPLQAYIGNYAKNSLYEALKKTNGEAFAEAVINGKIGNSGGKGGKNSGGKGGNKETIAEINARVRKTLSESEVNEATAERIRMENKVANQQYNNALFRDALLPQPLSAYASRSSENNNGQESGSGGGKKKQKKPK